MEFQQIFKAMIPMNKCHFHNVVLLTMAFLFASCLNCNALAESADEHLIKAAMVRNFARFTEWPEKTITEMEEKDLQLCVMGDDTVEQTFRKVRGKKVGNHTIVLREIDTIGGLQGCNLLFVDVSAGTDLEETLHTIQESPVLTIGETEEFTQAGGIITFFNESNRIRFQINLKAVQKAGLKISSRLLQLAVVIGQSSREHDK